MNSTKIIAYLVAALFVTSCSSRTASAKTACEAFLFEGNILPSQGLVEFDIEKSYAISPNTIGSTYESLHGLDSGCVPLNIDAVPAAELGVVGDTPEYKDIDSGSQDGRTWVQFIYPSLGEDGPGLTSSITFYDAKGEPVSSNLVSFYHSWEGAQKMSSEMKDGKIVQCAQRIEFFSYTESGDIDEELIEPLRSECDLSYEVLP